MARWLGLLVVMVLLGGCTAGMQDLANSGDWYEIGYRDGVKGQPARSYKALNELGTVDRSQYDEGYLEGVSEYCNPDFAYQIGMSGQLYEGVCEGTKDAQRFRMEWQRGWNDANSN
jgi:hypothetical protein